jgi:uncharacterized membrane-anchored protein YhcB (DUF1043 family)
LIKVHDTGRTYGDQLRNLMLVKPEIEEIEQDLEAAKDLFGPNTKTILKGIRDIITYLADGAKEYESFYKHVDKDAKAEKRLADTIAAQDMEWVRQLIADEDFPKRYDDALKMSKKSCGRLSSARPRREPRARNTLVIWSEMILWWLNHGSYLTSCGRGSAAPARSTGAGPGRNTA